MWIGAVGKKFSNFAWMFSRKIFMYRASISHQGKFWGQHFCVCLRLYISHKAEKLFKNGIKKSTRIDGTIVPRKCNLKKTKTQFFNGLIIVSSMYMYFYAPHQILISNIQSALHGHRITAGIGFKNFAHQQCRCGVVRVPVCSAVLLPYAGTYPHPIVR